MSLRPIAIVGDYNASNQSHGATGAAIEHCSAAAGLTVNYRWLGTEELIRLDAMKQLAGFSGLWIGPGSPYKSMQGALWAIRMARERRIPLLGTCGGFQHILLEYARNVLGFIDAQHEETDPGAARLFISRLACSLVGRTLNIKLQPGSMIARLYERTHAREQYQCNFGVNPGCVESLRSGPLQIVGSDDEGVVRAVELAEHPFFIGTLFLPQLISTPASPHPLISGFIKACWQNSAV